MSDKVAAKFPHLANPFLSSEVEMRDMSRPAVLPVASVVSPAKKIAMVAIGNGDDVPLPARAVTVAPAKDDKPEESIEALRARLRDSRDRPAGSSAVNGDFLATPSSKAKKLAASALTFGQDALSVAQSAAQDVRYRVAAATHGPLSSPAPKRPAVNTGVNRDAVNALLTEVATESLAERRKLAAERRLAEEALKDKAMSSLGDAFRAKADGDKQKEKEKDAALQSELVSISTLPVSVSQGAGSLRDSRTPAPAKKVADDAWKAWAAQLKRDGDIDGARALWIANDPAFAAMWEHRQSEAREKAKAERFVPASPREKPEPCKCKRCPLYKSETSHGAYPTIAQYKPLSATFAEMIPADKQVQTKARPRIVIAEPPRKPKSAEAVADDIARLVKFSALDKPFRAHQLANLDIDTAEFLAKDTQFIKCVQIWAHAKTGIRIDQNKARQIFKSDADIFFNALHEWFHGSI